MQLLFSISNFCFTLIFLLSVSVSLDLIALVVCIVVAACCSSLIHNFAVMSLVLSMVDVEDEVFGVDQTVPDGVTVAMSFRQTESSRSPALVTTDVTLHKSTDVSRQVFDV